MASNQIQFQHCMSIPELLYSFGTEAIKAVRWPEGFRCPRCVSSDHYVVGHGARQLFQCNGCRHQTSLAAGCLMPGGERAGGKVGRGSENKTPFVAAVSVNDHGHSMYIKLNVVRGYTSEAMSKWRKANLLLGTSVHSDELACSSAVADAGCLHLPMVVGSLKPRDLPSFKCVNTVLGNLKTTLAGVYHALKYRKYAEQHCLAGFTCRFSGRFNLRGLVESLIVDVVRAMPIEEKTVRTHAGACF